MKSCRADAKPFDRTRLADKAGYRGKAVMGKVSNELRRRKAIGT